MIVRFIDIAGIIDRLYLHSLFITCANNYNKEVRYIFNVI